MRRLFLLGHAACSMCLGRLSHVQRLHDRKPGVSKGSAASCIGFSVTLRVATLFADRLIHLAALTPFTEPCCSVGDSFNRQQGATIGALPLSINEDSLRAVHLLTWFPQPLWAGRNNGIMVATDFKKVRCEPPESVKLLTSQRAGSSVGVHSQ